MHLKLTGTADFWQGNQAMWMQIRQQDVVICKYSGRADPPNGCPWLILSITLPWRFLNTQFLNNFKKILHSSGGLRMYCISDIESFPKSIRDIGRKPTILESEFPRWSKRTWRLISPQGLTFGNLPFRRISLRWGVPFRKVPTWWKRWVMVGYSPDTKISDATWYSISR